MIINNESKGYTEEFIVKFTILNKDSGFTESHEEVVLQPSKSDHDKAAEFITKKYLGSKPRIISVTYI